MNSKKKPDTGLRRIIDSTEIIMAGGYRLSPADSATFRDAVEAWTFFLRSYLVRDESTVVLDSRLLALTTAVMQVASVDINVLFSNLSTMSRYMLTLARRGTEITVRSFKGYACRVGCHWLANGVLTRQMLVGEHRWIQDWRFLYGSLRFLAKLPLSAGWLKAAMLEKFESNLIRVADLSWANDDRDIKAVNTILKEWLSQFSVKTLRPRHGPGSVSEGKTARFHWDKCKILAPDKRIDFLFQYRFGDGDTSHLRYEDITGHYHSLSERYSTRTAKLVFVPKTSMSLRTICSEPCTLQYFQQGVRREISAYFRSNKALRSRIDLSKQEHNQVLAKIGSCEVGVTVQNPFGNWVANMATLDQSMASDSISWLLLRRLFAGTELLLWMQATRSTHISLPTSSGKGRRVCESPIFAPMGSALCFPIQCLVFAAITETVRRRFRNVHGQRDIVQRYRVYGDDIVVPAVLAEPVMALLRKFGFIPNVEKSFWTGAFRESCGKEYYHGTDVSPLYYRIQSDGTDLLSPETFGGICTAANNAAVWGATALRKHLLRRLHRSVAVRKNRRKEVVVAQRCTPLFVSSTQLSPAVWSPNVTNYLLRSRWNEDIQARQYYSLSTKTKEEGTERLGFIEDLQQDGYRYRTWLIDAQRPEREYAEPLPRVTGGDRNKILTALRQLRAKPPYWGEAHGSCRIATSDRLCIVDTVRSTKSYGKVQMVFTRKWTHLLG